MLGKGIFILEITELSQCKRQAAGLMREQLSNKCRPDKRGKAPYLWPFCKTLLVKPFDRSRRENSFKRKPGWKYDSNVSNRAGDGGEGDEPLFTPDNLISSPGDRRIRLSQKLHPYILFSYSIRFDSEDKKTESKKWTESMKFCWVKKFSISIVSQLCSPVNRTALLQAARDGHQPRHDAWASQLLPPGAWSKSSPPWTWTPSWRKSPQPPALQVPRGHPHRLPPARDRGQLWASTCGTSPTYLYLLKQVGLSHDIPGH